VAQLELGVGQQHAPLDGEVGAPAVDGQRQPPQLGGEDGTDPTGDLVVGDVLVVVADRGLRRRGEQRLRQAAAVLEPRGQRRTADPAGRAVVGEPRAGEVAAGDALDGDHGQAPAQHRPAPQRGGVRLQHVGVLAGARGHQVGGHEVGELAEPPDRQPGEHRTLVGHGRRQHHVVRAEAVARDQQQVVGVDLVQLADLAPRHEPQRQAHRSFGSSTHSTR
jgi:hypothetical protein